MPNCCSEEYNLGCIDSCGTVTLAAAVDVTETGDYLVKFSNISNPVVTIAGTSGVAITYTDDGTVLQPGYTYRITITGPSGNTFTRTIDAVEYDCFKLTVEEKITI